MELVMPVDDAGRAVSYYEHVVGAKPQYRLPQTQPLEWASLLLGEVEIMFWQKDAAQKEYTQPLPISEKPANFIAYIYVDDADAIYDRIRDRIKVIMAPKEQFYGVRELTVQDPFGHVLTFAQMKS
jgi:uncharacterized glyoxalase superfamily protein PhnB